jgi:hypothetical protein
MRKTGEFLLLSALVLSVIFLLASGVHAGTTQNETGQVFNSDLSVPADGDIIFNAFIVGRESEVQTESSPGAGYGSGFYQVNVGNFPTAWAVGETLHIDFSNLANSESGSLDIVLESVGHSPANGNQVDVTLISSTCIVTLSVQGFPYGGIGFSGERVTVQIDPSDRVAGIDFDLSFDSGLMTVSSASLTAAAQGWALSTDTSTAGRLSVSASSPTQTPLASGNDVGVVDVLIDVDAGASPGSVSSLTFANVSVTNDSGQSMSACDEAGSFTICRKGDAVADGAIDVSDLIKILRVAILLDPTPTAVGELCVLDLTGDGVVNVVDVVRALRASVGL